MMTAPEKNYFPQHGCLWDFWVIPHRDVYHLYYLHNELDDPPKNVRNWSIGHAISRDLIHWQELSVVLRADPALGIYGLATGSGLYWEGRGVMAVTVQSGPEDAADVPPNCDWAIALAFSEDMDRWTFSPTFPALKAGGGAFEPISLAKKNPAGCFSFGDPWLYNVPGDRRLHMLVNTRLAEGGMYSRGALAHAASADLSRWTPKDVFFAPDIAMRLETPQLFEKNGRWYLIVSCHDMLLSPAFLAQHGGAPLEAAAIVFTSPYSSGPFALVGDWALFPHCGCYICKVVPERDVIFTIRSTATQYPPRRGETGLTLPHRVSYPEDGGIRVLGAE
ncbi:hypothetical protein AGMMS49992_31270 [Clostridia bacterium]|nr:hypothetical protein AGMMS49992_31270 [Clostridia bacterium]